MRTYFRYLLLAGPALLATCTATSETSAESAAPRSTSTATSVAPVPMTPDEERRALYNSNRPAGSNRPAQTAPDATPNTLGLGEQAAGINRYERPNTLNTNDPNTTTTETHLDRIDRSIPDTLRQP